MTTTATSRRDTDHFAWVALAYGKRLNFGQIANLPGKERMGHWELPGNRRKRAEGDINIQAIQKAVHEKAQLIGLPRLRTTVGRPKK
jgi:hypothetical protein